LKLHQRLHSEASFWWLQRAEVKIPTATLSFDENVLTISQWFFAGYGILWIFSGRCEMRER
jgi:hypothetical protein